MLKVDRSLCLGCGLCVQICPQGAIFNTIVISPEELEATVGVLKNQTDDIIRRIERLFERV